MDFPFVLIWGFPINVTTVTNHESHSIEPRHTKGRKNENAHSCNDCTSFWIAKQCRSLPSLPPTRLANYRCRRRPPRQMALFASDGLQGCTGSSRWLADATIHGLGTWAAFQKGDDGAMLMGDTVVFQDEVNPGPGRCLCERLEVTVSPINVPVLLLKCGPRSQPHEWPHRQAIDLNLYFLAGPPDATSAIRRGGDFDTRIILQPCRLKVRQR